MAKIAVELDLKQIEQIISQLRSRDRITLVRRLEQKTWGERFRSLVAQMDERRRKYPVSQKELRQILKQARRERYAASRS
ncbi:MAG: hypothetical protein HY584_00890 [Candidatus Omnitrophica bacterium]|nr:hypothetical protein [Candidatus Omnitrophota bacterium]